MNKYKSVDLDYSIREKLNILSAGKIEQYSEMSNFQSAFLCGLIKSFRPHKILEIGISAGVTTCIVLECLSQYQINAEVYSVDVKESWYRGSEKRSGFLKDEILKDETYNHRFILGKAIPQVIAKIGKDIDFLILDTTHSLPGELLDFLVCYPFLSNNCMVVLHDLISNLSKGESWRFATKLLFDVIDAEKYYMRGQDIYPYGFSNIGAFMMNEMTSKSLVDVFSSLSFSWSYMFEDSDKNAYSEIIKENYSADLYNWYLNIIQIQEFTDIKTKVKRHYGRNAAILDNNLERADKIYIYGAGYWGNIYTQYVLGKGLTISGYIVSDEYDKGNSELPKKYSIPIYYLSEINVKSKDSCSFVLAFESFNISVCIKHLEENGFYNII